MSIFTGHSQGYMGIKPHNDRVKMTYEEPQYKQVHNPFGLYRHMHKTLADQVVPVDMNRAFDPAIQMTQPTVKESFTSSVQLDSTDEILLDTYLQSLVQRALAVKNFCKENKAYAPWISNWKLLEKNLLSKNKLNFELLDTSDQDIAYVIDKGVKIRFRIHDNKRFLPINIYQYVLYHEMAHMSTTELQHTPFFHKLLNLLSLAAYELGFIDLKKISRRVFMSNGQGIASAEAIQDEIILGCNHMIQAHANEPRYVQYYTELRQHVAERV